MRTATLSRRPGIGRRDGAANVRFAGGPVGVITGTRFPRGLSSGDPLFEQKKAENFAGPTVYGNPEVVFR